MIQGRNCDGAVPALFERIKGRFFDPLISLALLIVSIFLLIII
jgi:hypothetical protein